jgi:cholesterol oxidase
MVRSQGAGHYDAIVVGSGFGGSICALRLAQAGKSVLVLERGRRYAPGEFPRDVRDADALLWRHPARPHSRGLFDVRFLSGIGTVTASGVGGGSLVYANIHIRPDPSVFEDRGWPAGFDRAALDPYYDRVQDVIGFAPVPEDVSLPKRDAFRRAAQRLGRECFDPDQAVGWDSCRYVAECEFGCPHGAKRTMDLTYLAEAERLGAEVRPDSLATVVAPVRSGYRVSFRNLLTGAPETVTGTRVVLAAGTLGTNELLLRSRDVARTLPGLSARLGDGYSGNGDFLGAVHGIAGDIEPWKGPDVTTVIKFFDQPPRFTMALPTYNRPVMEALDSLGDGGGRALPFAGTLWRRLGGAIPPALAMLRRARTLPRRKRPEEPRLANLFAIGQDNAGGRLLMRDGRLDIEWDYAGENAGLAEAQERAMADVARAMGGTFAPLVVWPAFRRVVTVHSLGGCRLAESPADGVVSPQGEVHGYPGLYVADGSVIPNSIGFHPVNTIAAVCERIAESLVGSYAAS